MVETSLSLRMTLSKTFFLSKFELHQIEFWLYLLHTLYNTEITTEISDYFSIILLFISGIKQTGKNDWTAAFLCDFLDGQFLFQIWKKMKQLTSERH